MPVQGIGFTVAYPTYTPYPNYPVVSGYQRSAVGYQPKPPAVGYSALWQPYAPSVSYRPYALDTWRAPQVPFMPVPVLAPTAEVPTTSQPPLVEAVNAIEQINQTQPVFQSRLKTLFHQRKAVTYLMHIRTFAAEDKNGDGRIDPALNENGTFLKAIKRLPELKKLGVNNIHLLPIMPIGKIGRLGEPGATGSPYVPASYTELNREYAEPGVNLSVEEQAKLFVDAAHRLGIHVMVDVPSCASIDLSIQRPDLIAKDAQGKPLVPTSWVDIRMFVKDSPALRDYFEQFFDLMANRLGVDGFRCDVARGRTTGFWQHFIGKYPDKAWFAETYTEEDASPMLNIPRDKPEMLYNCGFDSIYGQFHIFHSWNANEYMRYLIGNQQLLRRVGPEKSFFGTFETHDDPKRAMAEGGILYSKLISAMMCVQPDTNPYICDGFATGDPKNLDIFNWRQPPAGKHPEIGQYLQKMLALRNSPTYGPALRTGRFIPLKVHQNHRDPKVIAFVRQYKDRSLLVIANKDLNTRQKVTIEVPGLSADQKLANLAPSYGKAAEFTISA
ncbi:MAG: alpha amylase C-terminal domain-containing protein, partial [Cyanobacteria bacterium HKST-UBA05]|nr:alpha amylase C-terminal domain-containing protein [Cyanobacteria bacterium HKST-UBA05]